MSIRLRYDNDPMTRVGQILGDAFLVALIGFLLWGIIPALTR